MAAIRSSKTSDLTTATEHNIPEDGIILSVKCAEWSFCALQKERRKRSETSSPHSKALGYISLANYVNWAATEQSVNTHRRSVTGTNSQSHSGCGCYCQLQHRALDANKGSRSISPILFADGKLGSAIAQ
jgi:hypothetical protein